MYKSILLFTLLCQGQNKEYKVTRIARQEKNSAIKHLQFQANPNTQNYDLTYGKLAFTVNPALNNIVGSVTLTFKALTNMNAVTFELSQPLKVSSVKKSNTNLLFTHTQSGELNITLPATVVAGNYETIEINYAGTPPATNQAFSISTHNNTPVLYTLSEPYGAKDWWPCKQDLNDKLDSVDIYITAPSQYLSSSNGLEMSRNFTTPNSVTTHFKHNYPIPAYLIAIAVTNYVKKNTATAGIYTTFPIIDYIYPESDHATTASQLALTAPIINFFESKLGAYPYNKEKYGHTQWQWGGGMEHATNSFMVNYDRELLSHELAHQWFGDKITCGTWKDIWLNEGFTEYMSGSVIEKFDGLDAFNQWKSGKIQNITSIPTGNLYLYDSQLQDVDRIFSSRITYDKGAMVAHMLRYLMGDDKYFQALQNYLNDEKLAYKYATTSQVQAHLELTYGASLSEFFNDWIYKEGYPIYSITASNTALNQAKIQINQTQSITNPAQIGYVSYFEMPVPVRLILSNGNTLDLKLSNTYSGQIFTIDLPLGTTVKDVVFNPNFDIISHGSTASLSRSEYELDTSVRLTPNPSDDYITIDLPETISLQQVKVINTLGEEVLQNNQSTLSTVTLAQGVYQVMIITNKGIVIKKIIKK